MLYYFFIQVILFDFLKFNASDLLENLLVLEDFGKHIVLSDSCEKDVLADVGGETSTDIAHEVLHLLLLGLVLVDRHEVLSNVILDV